MKIKDGYLLKEVAGNHLIVPVGNVSFDSMITLNETGVLICKMLMEGTTKEKILNAFLAEYEVSEEKAKADIDSFLNTLTKAGLLDESEE
jgi:hypothetical protein